jgi:hypothetical protein
MGTLRDGLAAWMAHTSDTVDHWGRSRAIHDLVQDSKRNNIKRKQEERDWLNKFVGG